MHCPAYFILTYGWVTLAVLNENLLGSSQPLEDWGQGLSLFWCRVHGVGAVVNKRFDFRLILVEGKLVC